VKGRVDWYLALSEALSKEQQARFEQELNEYLVREIMYEQTQVKSKPTTGKSIETPVSNFFESLQTYGGDAGFSPSGLFPDGEKVLYAAVAKQDLSDRIVALILLPFKIAKGTPGAYRFFTAMIQAENTVVEQLIKDNCHADHFVHHMMDLAPVYDNEPPVSFKDQHALVDTMRRKFPDRLIPFSAFTPFRFDQFDLELMHLADGLGFAGVKYYPPSGYSATVESIPKKPPRFRGLIYQRGARKQWKARYSKLSSEKVQNNWEVELDDPDRVKEQTLEGISRRFFEFAGNQDLLIFAHHTPKGFESYKGYGKYFAEPCDWISVLEDKKLPDIKLVLGHGGGGGWYLKEIEFKKSFAKQAFNLCVSYENVYCDFGYHEEILTTKGKTALRDRLEKFEAQGVSNAGQSLTAKSCREDTAIQQYSIFDKLLYGSDWMMVIKETNYRDLAVAFDEVFSGKLELHKAKFFGGNAITILKKSGNAGQLPSDLSAKVQ